MLTKISTSRVSPLTQEMSLDTIPGIRELISRSDAVKKHKKAYVDDDDDEDENDLGAAAALQALKLFNSGETGEKQSKGAFLGLAMSEASKVSPPWHILLHPLCVLVQRRSSANTHLQLFDDKASKGKVSSGASKEGVIQKAGEFAMKMYLKSQGEQQGGLMGLASKFM